MSPQDDDIADLFASLFQGNQTRYGTEEGGSVVIDADWPDIAELHLTGEIEPIGVYPIDPDTGMCRWGCIDFDEGETESLIHATNVQVYLACEDVTAWVERSRSKGYHVWVFSWEWLDPEVMRDALLYACEFVEAPTKEINPKQVSLEGEQVGNYVRLPYPRPLFFGRRQMVWPDGMCISLTDFVHDAFKTRESFSQLSKLASHRHKPSANSDPITYTSPDVPQLTDENGLVERLSRKARHIYDNGTRFVKAETGRPDRSEALVYLAGQIARDGTHNETECYAVLACADVKWGKYSNRTDGPKQLEKIVERAFLDKESFY